jgi:hypothetical protein
MERRILLVKGTLIHRGLEHQEINEHPPPHPHRIFPRIVVQDHIRAPEQAILVTEHKGLPPLGVLIDIAHVALQAPAHRHIHKDLRKFI